jgi:exodeoxyribonuclease VII small subunit
MKKELTYSKAIQRLEEILKQVESEDVDIDHLTDSLKEAKELLAFCKGKLYKIDKSIQDIFEKD